MRRGSPKTLLTLAAAVALVALMVVAPAAMAGAIFPESGGSENANDISTLYKITFFIGLVIFIGVEGALIWSLLKFKARRGGPPAQQIRGNTRLEIGWTLGAALIVLVLAVVTFLYLPDINNPPASGANGLRAAGVEYASVNQPKPPGEDALDIEVNGQQYLWRFDYAGEEQLFNYYEMVVPVDTTVTLDITSQDVVHSWWIPKLGGKADAVPGHTNQTWFKITKPGLYRGVCAELCGDNHADMRAVVRAVPVDEYEAWAADQTREIRGAQQSLAISRRLREQQEAGGEQQEAGEEQQEAGGG